MSERFVKWRSRQRLTRDQRNPANRPLSRAGRASLCHRSIKGAGRRGENAARRENRDNHDPERRNSPLYTKGQKAVFIHKNRFLIFNLLNINIIGCNTVPA